MSNEEIIKALCDLRLHVELEMCAPIDRTFEYIDALNAAIEAFGGDPFEEEEEEE